MPRKKKDMEIAQVKDDRPPVRLWYMSGLVYVRCMECSRLVPPQLHICPMCGKRRE